MMHRLKALTTRQDSSILEDVLGLAVLFAVLYVTLALPGAA
ncbi:hypothetical protein [Neotabrizicola sp. sgz301269]